LSTILARHYDVEVIGCLRQGESVISWFADYPYLVVRQNGLVETMREVERRITGDVVLACGLSMMSFGVGLVAKRRRRLPLILDMNEWETFDCYRHPSPFWRALEILRKLVGEGWSEAHSFKYRYVLDRLTGVADARTVACRFLERRYAGVYLPHGADPTRFDPAGFDRAAVRRKWNLPEDVMLVFFAGNPQPKKGVAEVVDAIRALHREARLVLVGRDTSHSYTRDVFERGSDNIIMLGPQAFDRMPELLAAADLVALPQGGEPRAQGYVPSKIYEAMAMGVPIISSTVSDMPAILDGCGYLVPPHDRIALVAAMEHVVAHPEEARDLGRRARKRVIEQYSWDVMDCILRDVVESVAH